MQWTIVSRCAVCKTTGALALLWAPSPRLTLSCPVAGAAWASRLAVHTDLLSILPCWKAGVFLCRRRLLDKHARGSAGTAGAAHTYTCCRTHAHCLWTPSALAVQGAAAQLCTAGAAGKDTIVSALLAGGADARNLLAALVWGSCSDPNAIGSAAQAFFQNSTELNDINLATR